MDFYHLLKIQVKINAIKNLYDSAKKSEADAIKTASKRAFQKTAEITGDLICNEIAYKVTIASKIKKIITE